MKPERPAQALLWWALQAQGRHSDALIDTDGTPHPCQSGWENTQTQLKSVATRRPTTVNCLKRWGVFEKNGQERLIQWRQNCHPPGRAPPRPRGRGFPCVKWDATERDPQLTLTHPVGASSTSGRVLVTAQDSLQGPTSTQFRRVSPGIFFKERPKRKSFHHTFIFRWIAPFQQHQVS